MSGLWHVSFEGRLARQAAAAVDPDRHSSLRFNCDRLDAGRLKCSSAGTKPIPQMRRLIGAPPGADLLPAKIDAKEKRGPEVLGATPTRAEKIVRWLPTEGQRGDSR